MQESCRTRTVRGLRSAPVGAEPDIHRSRATVSRSNRKKLESIYARVLPDSNGSRSPLCSGRCRTDIHRMSCTVSRSNRKKLELIYMQESCRTRTVRGLRSALGRCRTDIHRMSCTVSRSNRKKLESIYARGLPDSNGSRSPLCSGRCRTDIHRMSCTVSRSNRKKLESIYA